MYQNGYPTMVSLISPLITLKVLESKKINLISTLLKQYETL